MTSFLTRHWRSLLRAFLGLLLAIVVLQNSEPTRIDLLFWALPAVPKLALILASMLLGAGVWEVVRRTLRGAAR